MVPTGPRPAWWRVKQVGNLVNGSTLLGLAVAATGRCAVRRGPRGLVVATGYRLSVPAASAFTVGSEPGRPMSTGATSVFGSAP